MNEPQNYAIIPLTQGKFAIVDSERYQVLSHFHWRAVQAHYGWYAKTSFRKNGKLITISMHRFVAQTPPGQVPHHKNGNTLDNREANLENMTKRIHGLYHANNRILRKFAVTPTIQ